MIWVCEGDRLPTVAALQYLLNLTGGTPIPVTGVFDPATKTRVQEFQRMNSIVYAGTLVFAGRRTWEILLARANMQVVDYIDFTDRLLGLQDRVPLLLQHFNSSIDEIISQEGARPSEVMSILRRVSTQCRRKPVVLLRFFGHGSPGIQEVVGAGARLDVHHSGRTMDIFFNELSSSFAICGSIELHGCDVGRGPLGSALLARISRASRVPVSAGHGIQSSENVHGVRFEGLAYTAYPENNRSNWISRISGT